MSNGGLSPDLQRLAKQLGRKHHIPKATVTHPHVLLADPFMYEKLRDPDYVPYCLVKPECGRTRRTAYGFKCPDCGNQMNYDLTHYDGNRNVQYVGEPPSVEVATSGLPRPPAEWIDYLRGVAPAQLAARRLKHAEITAWNDAVDARKASKKGSK